MFHYSGSSSIFLFVYGLMLGWGIISESHKKAKVFVIAPGSKHTVGRCWEAILHPCCQNTSALSPPWPWSWTSPRQPLPTQQAVWWLGVLESEIVEWMPWLPLTLARSTRPVGSELLISGLIAQWPGMKTLKKARWEKIGSFWIITNRLLLPKTPNATWV